MAVLNQKRFIQNSEHTCQQIDWSQVVSIECVRMAKLHSWPLKQCSRALTGSIWMREFEDGVRHLSLRRRNHLNSFALNPCGRGQFMYGPNPQGVISE